MGSTSVITPEDVLGSLMNDGTIDSLRLKIINQLKANEELKRTTIKMAEQSRVLNTPGAEKQTKRELFDALRRELESQVLEKASKSVWELILDNNGMGKEINQTVERVFCKLSGREPPLFPPQPDPNAKKSKANANVKAGESGNANAKVKANASAKGKGKVVAKGKAKVKGKVKEKEKVREATSEKKEEEKSNSKKRSYSEVNAQTEGRGGGDGETGVVAMVEDTQVSKVVGLEEQQVEAKPEETSVVAMAEDPQV